LVKFVVRMEDLSKLAALELLSCEARHYM